MPGYRINDYEIGDTNLTSVMETLDNQRIGYHAVSLTEYNTSSKPKIAQGSRIEVNGALFIFDDSGDEDISGSPSAGTVYIKLTPAGESITASFTNDTPVWDDEKQGWYESGTNNRYLEFVMILSGSDYIVKQRMDKYIMAAADDVGVPKPWLTDTPPLGHILLYGQAISRTTYARLFQLWGTTFGVGNGSTTFNVPDFRGRMPLGQDNMGGSSANRVTSAQADTIGGVDGDEDIPYHLHSINTYDGSGATAGIGRVVNQSPTPTTYDSNYAGDASSTNNMPPYITVNWIVKY